MKITCIILEDEPLAMKRTSAYVEKTPTLELKGCFENALEAIAFLSDNDIDLIFLDIEMDELTGIEFMESVKIKGKVIITTAYDEYAIKGYELNVLDYLLKPFTYPRFLLAVDKFQKENIETVNYIFIKSGYQLEKIFLNDILFIEGMGDYRRIHTSSKKIMTLNTFSDLMERLPKSRFIRIHKSFAIALDKINQIERNVVIIGKERIPISAKYKDGFFRSINTSDS